uniref:glutathione gamma-glutamylcysteinyltransferase n=1 Tax=Entomoneis paludosa TaxID=265537 RepID=A0A6U2ZLC4_9STRA|mmetsp:Transcript_20825/g.43543  ORF Transcript_20825/g.43543 Transcript_20825/m.43543 type:complete len:129 (+) Transcript_20825:2-388(+)
MQDLKSLLVVSYSRSAIGQTGDGHFSPVAAYDAMTDSVLVLDVARFKYPPYWISVSELYQAMIPCDEFTQQSRGWFVLEPPAHSDIYQGSVIRNESKRPAEQIPAVGDENPCPAHPVKVEFCPNNQSQ